MKKLLKFLGMLLLIAVVTVMVAAILTWLTGANRMVREAIQEPFLSAFAIVKAGQPGQVMPAAELLDLEEKPHYFADYKGKMVLVNFWAPWCQPCLAELPALEKLRKERAGSDFEVLYVSMDYPKDATALRDSMKNLPSGVFPSFYTKDQTLWASLGINGLPTTILLNEKGEVVYTLAGDGPWDSQGAKDFIKNPYVKLKYR